MNSSTKFTLTAIGSAVVGAAIMFISITDAFSSSPKLGDGGDGGLPINHAYDHAHGHTRGIWGWRGNTSGIYYPGEKLKGYLTSLEKITSDSIHQVPDSNYAWNIAIYYGKGEKNKKNRLMTIFIPVLIYTNPDPNNKETQVVDVFIAKKYHDSNNPDDKKIFIPGKAMTYYDLYKKYYLMYEKKGFLKEGDPAIAFDSGSMFP